PLLNSSRENILAYAQEHKIQWREDESNASDDYLRNQIRHHLVPVFTEQLGLSSKAKDRTLRNLRDVKSAYFHFISEEYDARKKRIGDIILFSREQDWTPGTLRSFLHYAVSRYGFTADQIEQISRLQPGQYLDGAKNRICLTKSDWIIAPIANEPLPMVKIASFPAEVVEDDFFLTCKLTERPPELGSTSAQFITPTDLPLHLRPRRNGDRFQPLGMGGKSKKLQDYFVDKKVPSWLRDRIYLLCKADDEIVAIPGFGISEKFKVRPEDEQVIQISWFGGATWL
ncbi:MAG: tRNA lysidine(34) synthetase TilS, partial [Bacteroidota bacterium]